MTSYEHRGVSSETFVSASAPGGPHRGPYFDRMTPTGGVHAKITYNQEYKVWNAVYFK
jgi:hypothetical protein